MDHVGLVGWHAHTTVRRPRKRETTATTKNTKKRSFAMSVAPAAIPPKPKIAATIAMTKKTAAQWSMGGLPPRSNGSGPRGAEQRSSAASQAPCNPRATRFNASRIPCGRHRPAPVARALPPIAERPSGRRPIDGAFQPALLAANRRRLTHPVVTHEALGPCAWPRATPGAFRGRPVSRGARRIRLRARAADPPLDPSRSWPRA